MLGFLPEYARAVLYLTISLIAARVYFKFIQFEPEWLNRWFGAFLFLSVAAYFSVHFIAYAVLVLIVCSIVRRAMPDNVPAVFVALLPVIPTFHYNVPGFAGIQQIFGLDIYRVLVLGLLIPALASAPKRAPDAPPLRKNIIDVLVVLYVLWEVVLAFKHRPSFTDGLRASVEAVLFHLLPYLAITRLMHSWSQFRMVLVALVFTGILESFIGIFEEVTKWWFYRYIPDQLGTEPVPAFSNAAELRWGLLRIRGSIDGGIGMFLSFCLGAFIALWRLKTFSGWRALLTLFVFLLPILFTGTRGYWLTCVLMLATTAGFLFIKSPGRFVVVAIIGAFVVPTAQDYFLTHTSDPFGTFNYRAQLIRASMPMLWERPLFGWGTLTQLFATGRLEELRQGQGIIDMVNTYLGEALLNGIPGFLLFVGMIFFSVVMVLRRHNAAGPGRGFHTETAALLCSMLIAISVMLATISPIGHISAYLWLLFALSSVFSRLPPDTAADAAESFTLAPPAVPKGRPQRVLKTATRM